jgi:hypothetical protein
MFNVHGVVWCGVVWCGVVWCGVVVHGAFDFDFVLSSLVHSRTLK